MAGTTHKTSTGMPAATSTQIADLLGSANWEARLNAARVRRAEILEGRQKPPPPDPVAEHPAPTRFTAPDDPPPTPLRAVPETAPPKATAKTEPPVLRAVRPQALFAERGPAPQRKSRFANPTAMMAVTCCAALGFGFGVAVVLGSLPSSEPADPAEAVSAAAPAQVQTDPSPGADPVAAAPPTAAPAEPVVRSEPEPAKTEAPPIIRPVPAPNRATPSPVPEAVASVPADAPEPATAQDRQPDPLTVVDTPSDTAPAIASPLPPAPAEPVAEITPELQPAATPTQVYVYAPPSVTDAALDQNTIALAGGGFGVAAVQRINLTISSPHVRYYDRSDAGTAGALATGLKIEARDFSQSGNGAPGRIEIWLDGRGTQPFARARQIDPIDELNRLRERIIRSLQ